MTPYETLAHALRHLDCALLVRRANARFEAVGDPPPWLAGLFRPGNGPQLIPADDAAFLEAFLQEAEAAWASGPDAVIDSGPWMATGPQGKEQMLTAEALVLGALPVLLISPKRFSLEEKQSILQKSRELALDHGRLRRLERRLQAANEATRSANEKLATVNERLKAAIAETRKLAKKADAASRAKGDFLANMSHEIRTPINGILGSATLLSQADLAPEQREYVEIIQNSGESLLGIINDILDFSKIEAGKLALCLEDFPLDRMLETVTDTLALPVLEKGIEFATLIDPRVPEQLHGDPGRLRQILLNLATNAVKFTDSGSVVIRIAPEEETPNSHLLRFSVFDTGIGIAPDVQERIFESFSQADGSISRRFGGTGLGLAISRQLSTMMGGRIGMESRPGAGSTFWFTARLGKAADFGRQDGKERKFAGKQALVVAAPASTIGKQLRWDLRGLGFDVSKTESVNGPGNTGMPADQWPALDMICMEVPDASQPLSRFLPAMPSDAPGRRRPPLILVASRENANRIAENASFQTGDQIVTKPVKRTRLRACVETALVPPDPRRPASTQDRFKPPASAPSVSLLLADDNRMNRMIAKRLLEKLGFQVDTAQDGIEAIDRLRQRAYQAVLMDVEMPNLDGLEATRRIRDPRTGVTNPAVPIIALTANAMKEDLDRCLEAGMNDFVSKPFQPESLSETIRRQIAPPVPTASAP